MKRKHFIQLAILAFMATGVIITSSSFKNNLPKQGGDDLQGTISISGAFALYPMAVKWADEFKKLHPKVTFNVSAGGAGKGITDALSGLVDIGPGIGLIGYGPRFCRDALLQTRRQGPDLLHTEVDFPG